MSEKYEIFTPGQVMFLNPFTGDLEPFRSDDDARRSMFEAASKRISELQEEIDRIKAHLVM